jgi:hypothetical protein
MKNNSLFTFYCIVLSAFVEQYIEYTKMHGMSDIKLRRLMLYQDLSNNNNQSLKKKPFERSQNK